MKKSIILSTLTLILAIGVVQTVAQDYVVQVELIISVESISTPELTNHGFFSRSSTPLPATTWPEFSGFDLWTLKSGNRLPAVDHSAATDRLVNTRLSNNCPIMNDRMFHQVKLEKVMEAMPVQIWQPAYDWVRPASDWQSNPGMKNLLHDGAGIRLAL